MKTLAIVGNCQNTALAKIMKYKYNLSNQYNIFWEDLFMWQLLMM